MRAVVPAPLFDAYAMVDWSAAAVPRLGRDSIWWALLVRSAGGYRDIALENLPTREAATVRLAEALMELSGSGLRTLVGFDFPFGYPAGTARALGRDGVPWHATWSFLAASVRDGADNANDRFGFAAALNRRMSGRAFPFWGHPPGQRHDGLNPRKPRDYGPDSLEERRLIERQVRRAKPVWQLAYTGSVGSQVLMGLPRVWALRRHERLSGHARIWPFETGLAPPRSRPGDVVLAEIYPSLVEPDRIDGLPKDAGQVRATVRAYARLDETGRLGPLFAGNATMSEDARRVVLEEEAWILGITDGAGLPPIEA